MNPLFSSLMKAKYVVFVLIYLMCLPIEAYEERSASTSLSPKTQQLADFTLSKYKLAAKNALAEMVAIETVNYPNKPLFQNAAFDEFRDWVQRKAKVLNLEFADHGAVLIIATGSGEKKLGLITHGDVQPANLAKWQQSPFFLDDRSEPGKWIGRGTEDDKGPIAAALYAMKSLNDQNITFSGRVELIIYLAEESDWEPLREFLKSYQPAPINIALDSEYPVVTAEKAWSSITVNFGVTGVEEISEQDKALLISFKGGSFRSQIPEDAVAVARHLTPTQVDAMQTKLTEFEVDFNVQSTITNIGKQHIISVRGLSAHSSKPEQGRNAINFLAAALSEINWSPSPVSQMVDLLDDLVGIGYKAENFGKIAYQHEFMGPLTLSPTLINKNLKGELELFINLRRPLGKTEQRLKNEIEQVLSQWQTKQPLATNYSVYIGEPYWAKDAPHVPKLLDIFATFTGAADPRPVAIGGSTNAKLFPQAVSFGPSMPGKPYTGHSEKEFITEETFALTLQMYTAMIYELAARN